MSLPNVQAQVPYLTNRLSTEFGSGQGAFTPTVAQTWRGNLPSYANVTLQHVSAEPVVCKLHFVGPIGSGSLQVGAAQSLVSGAGFVQTNNISLASSDTGQVTFDSVSTSVTTTDPTNFPTTGLIVSHPTITLAGSQGTPANGVLAPGQSYTSLGLQVNITILNAGPNPILRSDGVYTVVLTTTVNVHGSVTNH